jgi:hypothetical protein
MKKRYYILIAVVFVVLVASAVSIYLYTQQPEDEPEDTWPPPDTVELSPGGDVVSYKELILLFGWNSSISLEDVESLIGEFGGEITDSIPQTYTYEVKFPTSNLEELDIIADKLLQKRSDMEISHQYFTEKPLAG